MRDKEEGVDAYDFLRNDGRISDINKLHKKNRKEEEEAVSPQFNEIHPATLSVSNNIVRREYYANMSACRLHLSVGVDGLVYT